MPDDGRARWAAADTAAARLVATAIVTDHGDPGWTAVSAQAGDLLALILYVVAVRDAADPASVPALAVRDALTAVNADHLMDAALAGAGRADWRDHLRRQDPSVTFCSAHGHAVQVINAVVLAETRGLRLLERVLAPLHGRDALYPGQLLEVSVDRPPAGSDDLWFLLRVKMDHHRGDYNYVDA